MPAPMSNFKRVKPQFDLHYEKILLYGDWKIGKTSLVAALPFDVVFIATEDGHKKVDCIRAECPSWAKYLEIIKEVEEKPSIKMIAIDTIDNLWTLFLEYFLKKHNVTHEGEIPFKGYSMLTREFCFAYQRLQHLNKGYILIAHERTDTENDISITRPNLPADKGNQIRDAICGSVDYIMYMQWSPGVDADGKPGQHRVIRTQGSDKYVAGSRWPLPDPLPLINDDPARSALRLVNAYKKSAESATTPTGATAPIKPETKGEAK